MSILTMDEAEQAARIAEFVALIAGEAPLMAADRLYTSAAGPRRAALAEPRAAWPLSDGSPYIRLVSPERDR